jgi:hypothetical protein
MTYVIEWKAPDEAHGRFLSAPPMFGRWLEWSNDLAAAVRFPTLEDAEGAVIFIWSVAWTSLAKIVEVP